MQEVSRVGAYGVAIFAGCILLVRQAKGPLKDLLDLPGGGLEGDETPAIALKREFMEEVGGEFEKEVHFETLSHTHSYSEMIYHLTAHIYFVTGFAQSLIPQKSPELPYSWYSLEEILDHPLTPVAKRVVLKILDQKE